jgi:phage-related minor tail protein
MKMTDTTDAAAALSESLGSIDLQTRDLERAADGFSRAIASAFARAAIDGRKLEDVLRGLGLRLSDMVLRLAMKPVENMFSGAVSGLFGGLSGGQVQPFAEGGVIASPVNFPMAGGATGRMGEAGPEAILPLSRGADGRLGVAAQTGGNPSVSVVIQTPDAESFRRSEAYVSGMVARAVARSQRHS